MSDSRILIGDCREILRTLTDESVHCVVTSPPYWGLRDYGVDGQLGLEPTPELYVEHMVEVFREVRRVLRSDGTLWLNLGDCWRGDVDRIRDGKRGYRGDNTSSPGKHGYRVGSSDGGARRTMGPQTQPNRMPIPGLKPKDLVGIPWRVAFALQADGWWLRSDIVWAKPNPMPESVRDRPTRAHEYLFLLTRSERYYYDVDAIREPALWPDGPNSPESIKSSHGQGFSRHAKKAGKDRTPSGWDTGSGNHRERVGRYASGNKERKLEVPTRPSDHRGSSIPWEGDTRNKRSVWWIATRPFPEAHFATFPEALVEPCILAGCPAGGTVLDPFAGSGTVGVVAQKLGRSFIGIELKPEYAAMARGRIDRTPIGMGL